MPESGQRVGTSNRTSSYIRIQLCQRPQGSTERKTVKLLNFPHAAVAPRELASIGRRSRLTITKQAGTFLKIVGRGPVQKSQAGVFHIWKISAPWFCNTDHVVVRSHNTQVDGGYTVGSAVEHSKSDSVTRVTQ
jgi:hypothetical protein